MNPVSSIEPYEMELTVQPSEIDRMGHVNNVVYVQWVQNAATAHWYAAATQQQKAAYLWVVAKHEIEYLRPSMEGEELVVRTWVGRAVHRLFRRNTEISRKSDGKLVARAVTLWAAVDSDTKRPITPNDDVYAMFSVSE